MVFGVYVAGLLGKWIIIATLLFLSSTIATGQDVGARQHFKHRPNRLCKHRCVFSLEHLRENPFNFSRPASTFKNSGFLDYKNRQKPVKHRK
ncbi:hypothethical protein [Ralstonia solanacearum PSI07]|nr:hypothethical protein [Ralstonia solanacearum PSI07]